MLMVADDVGSGDVGATTWAVVPEIRGNHNRAPTSSVESEFAEAWCCRAVRPSGRSIVREEDEHIGAGA